MGQAIAFYTLAAFILGFAVLVVTRAEHGAQRPVPRA